MVSRDFRSRYLNSLLGSFWAILNPLSMILIYTLVFSQVMRAKLPGIDDTLGYSIYLCAGILPWQFFTEVLLRCQNVFLEQSALLKKVSFPRTSLPIYIFLSAGINYIILMVLFMVFLAFVGRWPNWSWTSIIVLVTLQQGFAVGLGIFLGTLHVFFRDVGHVLGVVLQFWFWLTPMVYPIEVVPENYRWLLGLNPMTGIVQGYQKVFLHNQWPNWWTALPMAVLCVLFLFIGYKTFTALDKEMVDEL
ncbi:ABC transporter permease [Candidatus Contubernalis alkaliaceticus]|uniref:ABC transporter permease n=1 Tax=Candidatus Contubernalis alkaliaceticus TaxID=338645 RepID=UPI001F4BFDB2|nr:ABC transporter permease [Candidatus Contubernalis alkalaceticus]UNC93607.1 ABC transporter permease [Candidatus Contubernalis alkalaceticus]